MIDPHDRIVLPDGVELRDGALHDVVRLWRVPVNATGLVVLGAARPKDAATALERRYDVDSNAALQDVLRLCSELNRRSLVNLAPRGGRAALACRWLRQVPFLLPLGILPRTPTSRRAVETAGARALAITAPRALAPLGAALLVGGTLLSALLLAALGVFATALAVTVGAATATSVLLHELAHLAALRGVPACVVIRGLRVAIVHRATSPTRRRMVAVCGPGAGLAFAASLLAALWALPSIELGAASFVALLNAVGLTVLSGDGRTLCGLR